MSNLALRRIIRTQRILDEMGYGQQNGLLEALEDLKKLKEKVRELELRLSKKQSGTINK